MDKQHCSQIFVYGSLRQGFNSPAYAYVSRYFELIGFGKVRGRLYDLGDYPAAVPDAGDYFIIGELYRIRDEAEFNWAMAQLDDYEGVEASVDEPPLYHRKQEIIYMEDGSETRAWVYWYDRTVAGRPVIASGDVLEYRRHK